MGQKHPEVVRLAEYVALLDRRQATHRQREEAVALAVRLHLMDEISRMKCLEVGHAAGATTPALDAAIRALEEERSGDIPPEWTLLSEALGLDEEALTKMAASVAAPPMPSERLRGAARHLKSK